MITYLGWLIPWGTPLTLLGQSAAEVAAAQRDLVRIGIDGPACAATGGPDAWSGGEAAGQLRGHGLRRVRASQREQREVILLDVRRQSEWQASRITAALHIPLHELSGRLGEIGPGQIWVHCQSGYRASLAAGLLDAAGRDVVLIDDDFASAERAGLADSGAVPGPLACRGNLLTGRRIAPLGMPKQGAENACPPTEPRRALRQGPGRLGRVLPRGPRLRGAHRDTWAGPPSCARRARPTTTTSACSRCPTASRPRVTTSACTTWPGRSARWPSWPRPGPG